MLQGDNQNRHHDFREFIFELSPCVDDATRGIKCVADPLGELAKMELFILYNTESFDKRDASADPIRRESVIQHLNFNPNKRYELKSRIT